MRRPAASPRARVLALAVASAATLGSNASQGLDIQPLQEIAEALRYGPPDCSGNALRAHGSKTEFGEQVCVAVAPWVGCRQQPITHEN